MGEDRILSREDWGDSRSAVNNLVKMSHARGWLYKVKMSLENTLTKVKIARERTLSF